MQRDRAQGKAELARATQVSFPDALFPGPTEPLPYLSPASWDSGLLHDPWPQNRQALDPMSTCPEVSRGQGLPGPHGWAPLPPAAPPAPVPWPTPQVLVSPALFASLRALSC